MKKFYILIILFLVYPFNICAQKDLFLELDSKGHQGMINCILVTKDKKNIVTVSRDKTIRVWDISSGSEVKKIIGNSLSGAYGKYYSADLTNDNKFLAAAGFMGARGSKNTGDIRIFDFETGKIHQVLKGHSSPVNSVDFDSSGSFLVSTSFDKTVRVWKKDNNQFSLYKTFSNHTDVSYSAVFFTANNKKYIVSAGWDNKLILYDLNKGFIKSYNYNKRLKSIAVSSKYIAAAGDGKSILIFDHNLKLVKEIFSKTNPLGLSFSPNGRYLLSGSISRPRNCNIYDSFSNFNKTISFTKHNNVAFAAAFIDNETAVTGGGNNFEIFIWNIKTGQTVLKIAGQGSRIWSLGMKNNAVVFGNSSYFLNQNDRGPFQKEFSLQNFQVSDYEKNQNKLTDLSLTYGSYKIFHKTGGPYNNNDGVLEISKNNQKYAEIIKTSSDGYSNECYGITKKGAVISGGANGHLIAYSLKGKKIADLRGHTGTVWAIASHDNTLVSGGDDQIIKFWDLNEIDLNPDKAKSVYPFLNLFISQNNEWVLWTRSGYYDSSIKGDDFIGYHVNKGFDKKAEYYPSSRFFNVYYNPGLISNIIKLKNEEKAVLYTKNKSKVNDVKAANILPPEIILNSPQHLKTSSNTIDIDFYVNPNSTHEIKQINIYLNGRELGVRAIKRKKQNKNYIHITQTITLDQKQNIIKLSAENEYSKSNPVYINAEFIEHNQNIFKPSLYVLSVGVSQYMDNDLNLGYAAKDALAVSEIFEDQANKIYSHVKTRVLTDEKATRIGILKGINWLKKEATQKDVVIIFIAGHGVNDEFNTYFFLPHDADREFLSGTAVKWIEFDNLIKNLPSKVILMADSCHSGNIMGAKRRSADITGALKELLAAGTGQVIMTATTGGSFAYEDKKWGHGAFTKALYDGLKSGLADYDKDNIISIRELDFYVTYRVKALTNGKQKPTTIVPQSIPDFPLVLR